MTNSGKCSPNSSASGTQTIREWLSVLLAISEQIGGGLTAVMGYQDNIKAQSSMRGIIMHSAKGVTGSKKANKPSTKKKSKKGTAKEPGTNSSSKAVKSVKGVKWI